MMRTLAFFCLACCSRLYAADITATLDSSDGSSGFSFKDSMSVEQARIDSNGNFYVSGNAGIGSAAPGATLEVNGTAVIRSGLRLDAAGIKCGTAEMLIVDGKIGVGTDNPTQQMEITAAGGGRMMLRDSNNNNSWWLRQNGAGAQFAVGNTTDLADNNIRFNISANGNVGIGNTSASVSLEVAANKAIKVGASYLSSGGDYMHLASHEWYTGSAWVADGTPGGLIQIAGQNFSYYTHNGAGGHTGLFTINSAGTVSGTYGTYHTASDKRLKTDIVTIPDALDKALKLRGVNYRFKDPEHYGKNLRMGLIAQEVEQVCPEVVHTATDEIQTKAVQYEDLIGLLIEAVKELNSKVEAQSEEIAQLKGTNSN